ncbi:hypothetical protein D0S45_17325 [Marinifilum sp. JC120]|nr:hypothetical protein D0S45_17325 [Marinifilum sp. JC120]
MEVVMAEKNVANSRTSDNSSVVDSPMLVIENGKPVVSSLTIAAHFGKQHKNVLQTIEKLEIPKEFTELNFQPSKYTDTTGRTLPAYNLTRDGFSLLVMGFTGKKATLWKVRYIEAFNTMEQKLKKQMGKIKELPGSSVPELSNGAKAVLKQSRKLQHELSKLAVETEAKVKNLMESQGRLFNDNMPTLVVRSEFDGILSSLLTGVNNSNSSSKDIEAAFRSVAHNMRMRHDMFALADTLF